VADQIHDPDETAATRESQPSGQLTVLMRHELEAALVLITGEVDLMTAPRLEAVLDETLRTNARDIVIDLTETTFVDSAGIHILVQAQQRASRHVVVICGLGPVRRALELLGLVEPLNVVSTLDEYKLRRSGP